MKKYILTSVLAISIFASASSEPFFLEQNAHTKEVKKFYKENFRKRCGFTLAYLSQRHTRAAWENYYEADSFVSEFERLCPKGENTLKDAWVEPLYEFVVRFAKDSNKYPEC